MRPVDNAKWPFFGGLFLICMCGLVLQIAETRLLSVIAWYYLAFFAISMAMFGMTAGALIVYAQPRVFRAERFLEHLAWISVAMAVSIVVSAVTLVSSVVLGSVGSTMEMLLWLRLILSMLPPYVFAGMAISLALTRSPWPVGQVYGIDLLGAASGCLGALALLTWIDGISALIAVGAATALAGACFRAAWRASQPIGPPLRITGWPVLHYPAGLAVLLAGAALLNNAVQPGGIAPIIAKDQFELRAPAAQQWNSFSRIRVNEESVGTPAMWGPSPRMPDTKIAQRWMTIDGLAGTALYRFDGDLSQIDFLRYDVTNLAYAIRNTGQAAIIGVGGGRDMLSAYLSGFRDVTGVELNPIFINLLTRRFRDYNHLSELPGVRFHVDEARSWFARTTQRFDLIQMSLIDTWAATGAGAFSLSENGLYTVQGWRHFLNALNPTGVFTVSRWHSPNDYREMGRLLSLASAALRSQGVADPSMHIFLAGTPNLATIIVGRAPLTASDVAKLRAHVSNLGFINLVSPYQPIEVPVLDQVMHASTPQDFDRLVETYHIDLSPPTDDRPFFFNQLLLTDFISIRNAQQATDGVTRGNLKATWTIGVITLLSFVLVLCTIVAPSLPSLRRVRGSLAGLGTAYFALIGLGFMFIEIGIIQRASLFLGHPTYGLAIGLFGIILSTGLGALLSERWPLDASWKIAVWSAALFGFIVLLTFWLPYFVAMFEGEPLLSRACVALLAIIPAGVLMGFGFPTGLRLVNALDTQPTPWFWAVNGAAGVLAASMAVATSIAFSINTSLWIGAACYLLLAPIGIGLGHVGRLRTMARAEA